MFPSRPLFFSSAFQLFLLFLPLLTSPPPSSPLHLPSDPLPVLHIAHGESLKFSEMKMSLVSCPATRTGHWK